MKNYIFFGFILILLTSCNTNLSFDNKTFVETSKQNLDKRTPQIKVIVPIANGKSVISDSINQNVFSVVERLINLSGNKLSSKKYPVLLGTFIKEGEKLMQEFPEDSFKWEAVVEGDVIFKSDSLLNIKIKYFLSTGGAHENSGLISVLCNPKTGKTILNKNLFKNYNAFTDFAEKRFRETYKIPIDKNINSTGFQFLEDRFCLSKNIFFTTKGIQLYYNSYEVASYADEPKELFFSYSEINSFLKLKT